MKSKFKNAGIIISVIVLIALVTWFFFIKRTEKPVALQTENPIRGYIAQSVTATGKIEPVDTVSIGTQVSGIIQYLYADFNSKVKKGQLIARLDKSLLQATLDLYQGNLLNAESQLIFQKSNYERQNLLYKADAISKADYDSALNSYDAAKANVKSAQAQVRSAQKNLSYCDIYSPIDGVVLLRNISPGQTVAASFSTPTLFIIAKDITKMEVEAAVDEADIGGVKAGDRAVFTVDAFISDQFKGTVGDVRLHPTVSANVVTYTTIIYAPNNAIKLKPGMTANIIIYTKEVNNAMLIPVKALTFVPDSTLATHYTVVGEIDPLGLHKQNKRAVTQTIGHTISSQTDSTAVSAQSALVWILNGKILKQKRIQIGLNDNIHAEVLSGLSNNDLVVINELTGHEAAVAVTPGGSPFLPKRASSGGRNK